MTPFYWGFCIIKNDGVLTLKGVGLTIERGRIEGVPGEHQPKYTIVFILVLIVITPYYHTVEWSINQNRTYSSKHNKNFDFDFLWYY